MNSILKLSSNTTIEIISCLLDATKGGYLRSTFCFNIQCSIDQFKTNWIKKDQNPYIEEQTAKKK